jgi:cell division protein FtsW
MMGRTIATRAWKFARGAGTPASLGQMSHPARSAQGGFAFDRSLLWAAMFLLGTGLVMMASASMAIGERDGEPSYYLLRQSAFAAVSLIAAFLMTRVSTEAIERWSRGFLIAALALLVIVLIPGIGRTVNGSTRWISFVFFNIQPSELAKLFLIVFFASYIVRRGEELKSRPLSAIKPLLLLGAVCGLLMLEPDFGTAAVLALTVMGMMFLSGVRLWFFAMLLAGLALLMAILAISAPYRLARITAFLDPWADPFASGFQLTQALIAFGRGEWFGVGLGSSIQKLYYLPEAHTDFLFAVIAEELGLIGSLCIIGLFSFIVVRAFLIGRRAEHAGLPFAAYLAYGTGLWLGVQTFTNIGVNMGLLPTKGLTLPLMSYGGTSLLASCLAVAALLRVDHETRMVFYRRLGSDPLW